MSSPQVVVVIPARYGSTRLPGKPLVTLAGKLMIQRVYERAKLAQRVSRVVVATDDERILQAVHSFGGEAVMTRGDDNRFSEVEESITWQTIFPGGTLAHCGTSYNAAPAGYFRALAERGCWPVQSCRPIQLGKVGPHADSIAAANTAHRRHNTLPSKR